MILDVQLPNNPRHYRYALDWHAQPDDARPRLIGLAVAEAVDASRIELTAIAEPPRVIVEHPPPPPRSRRSIALVGERRVFTGDAGADLFGFGLRARDGFGAVDIVLDRATPLGRSGVVAVTSLSAAPSVAIRVGERWYLEAAIGARVGLVWMRGEALPDSGLVGTSQLRAWVGPFGALAIGIPITHAVTAGVHLELGTSILGATAKDLGQPVVEVDGSWLAFGVSAQLAL